MNDEVILRKQAIDLFLKGSSKTAISIQVGRSRQWVHKWIKRYLDSGTSPWFVSQSNSPSKVISKTPQDVEQLIIKIRKVLGEKKYSQKGALSIIYELNRLGVTAPSITTINRILKRNSLVGESDHQLVKKKDYPNYFTLVQQMDLVGPKYLTGGFRFYIMDIIEVETHFAGVYPLLDKSSMSIANALIDFWTNYGMPDYLQMDNELSFRGSNRYPRSLGLVLRLALSLHITPIFIPTSEPWRNGVIEKFNHNMQRHFLKTQVFESLDEMQIESKNFSAFHNNNHRYSSQQNKTPFEIVEKQHQFHLKNEIDLSKKIALTEGVVIFIRFIRSNAKLKILDSEFKINKQLVYSYVVVKVIIEQHVLIVLQDHKIHHIFPFNMPVDL